jgi:hypothetical protein
MKTALRLLFLVIISTALARETACSAAAAEAKEHQDARTAAQQAGQDRVAKKIHIHDSANLAKPNPSRPVPNIQRHLATGKHPDPQRPGPGLSTGPTKGALAVNRAANKTHSVQPSTTSRTSIPTSNNVRHRNPNPPVLGGPKSSPRANTAAINGSGISRKP